MKRFLDGFEKVLLDLSAALFAIVAVVVNVQVLARYVLHRPLTWATELSTLLLVAAVFFAAAVALRKGGFAAVTIIIERLPGRWRAAVQTIGSLLVFIFLVVGTFATTPLITQARITSAMTPALGVPMGFVYIVLQVSFGIQALYALAVTVSNAIRWVSPSGAPSDGEGRETKS